MLKIDEKHIEKVIIDSLQFIESLTEDIKHLADKNEDIFMRYVAYTRISSELYTIIHIHSALNSMFRCGFDLKHPILNTEKAKELGWDEPKIHKNPFFVNNDNDNEPNIQGIELDNISPDVIEKLKKAIKEKIMKLDKNHAH